MKVTTDGGMRASIAIEPGDRVALLDPENRIVAGPDVFPEKGWIAWSVAEGGWFGWAVLGDDDRVLLGQFDIVHFAGPGQHTYRLDSTCAEPPPRHAPAPPAPESDLQGLAFAALGVALFALGVAFAALAVAW